MTRYIDADALIGALHNHAFLEGDDRSICYNIIQKQPTVDAVPVKRGEWIETDEWDEFCGRLYKCSNCKTFVLGYFDNYCPYCGSDMRGNETS